MQDENLEYVRHALLEILAKYLSPYVKQQIYSAAESGRWPTVDGTIQAPDVDFRDLSALIFALTGRGPDGRPILDTDIQLRSHLHEARKARNDAVHGGRFDDLRTMSVLTNVADILRMIESDDGLAEITDVIGAYAGRFVGSIDEAVSEPAAPLAARPAEIPVASEPAITDDAAPAAAPEPDPYNEPEPGPEPGPGAEAESQPDVADVADAEDADEDASPLDAVQISIRTAPALSYAQSVAGVAAPIEVSLELPIPEREEPGDEESDEEWEAGDSTDTEVDVDETLKVIDAPRPGDFDRLNAVTVTVVVEHDDQQLVAPWTFGTDIGREPAVETTVVSLNRTVLLQMAEASRSSIRVRLEKDGDVREETVEGPDVLAARQWMLRGSAAQVFAPLATFVQPHQPDLVPLIRAAAAVLEASTGSRALEAYQSGPERVDQIVQALATAVHERGIAYANPPSNWKLTAQTVRTAEDVLEGRLATCMDTTMLMASALEYMDIEPLLVLFPTHILLGYWKSDKHAPEDIAMSGAMVVNDIDRGNIGLVETTMLTDTAAPVLAALHRAARRRIGPDGRDVQLVLSVREARAHGIGSLPARGRDENDDVVEVEYRPEARANTVVLDDDGPARLLQQKDKAPERVEVWKRQLLDLTLRNRLINCADSALKRKSIVELAVPEAVIGSFEDIISRDRQISLRAAGERAEEARRAGRLFREELDPPYLAPRLADHLEVEVDLTADAYDRALQRIATDARTLVEETGANCLYLAVGSLVWTTGRKDVRSPLVLVPVEMTRGSKRSPYKIQLDPTGGSTPNFSLLERLKVDLGLELPGLAEPDTDDAGIDLDGILDYVRSVMVQQRLPFHVEPTVYLGVFKFGGFRLWRDLEDSWEVFERNELVRHLIHNPTEPFEDPNADSPVADLDELVTRLPLPADASQAEAVANALAGRTIVVEGPPGTGKSQTITNMIVRGVADGQKIMFVAEKQAALDVVSRRLREAGIGDLVLNLHDRRQRATEVRAAILRALDVETDADREGARTQEMMLSTSGQELARYRDHLHGKNRAGLSFYSARTSLLALPESEAVLSVPPTRLEHFDEADLASLQKSLSDVSAALQRQEARYVGAFAYLRDHVDESRLPGILATADRVRAAYAAAGPQVAAVVRAGGSRDLGLLLEVLDTPWMDLSTLGQYATAEWQGAARQLAAGMHVFAQDLPRAFAYYTVEVLDGPLDDVRATVVEAKNAFFGKTKKTDRALTSLARYRTGQPMPEDPAQILAVIDELLTARDRRNRSGAQVNQLVPAVLQQTGGVWNPWDPQMRNLVLDTLERLDRASKLVPAPGAQPTRFQAAAAAVLAIPDRMGASTRIRECVEAGRAFEASAPDAGLRVDDLLASERAPGDDAERLRALRTWNDINAAVRPFREAGMSEAVQEMLTRTVDPVQLPVAFRRGLAHGSLEERGQRAAFAAFDPARQKTLVDQYATAATRVRQLLPGVMLDEVLQRRKAALEKDPTRLANLVSELRRRRSGRKIRELMAEYGDLITTIMPCVLVSPDSAARCFPAERQDFDVVVFDEASQIRVANAVGAMGRGRSVVVCGDSKQMPPTSFAELTREDELTDLGITDEESILGECVVAHVPRHWLSWHYRSQVESLIAFSNKQYYEGQLSSFPSPRTGTVDPGPGGCGISLRRVDGQFHRTTGGDVTRRMLRTNPVEAEAIVQEIRDRFDASPDVVPSIGVVTFNSQQRDLIETLLRDVDDPRITASMDATDGVFVKNLENVQGDERDTILFSVAFSAAANGVVPLNFGPLNREGGERRLNVAITRARRQVVMFCSFDVAQLAAERSESEGLRDLKGYLQLAEAGGAALEDTVGQARVTDRHRDEIAEALRDEGLSVQTDVGLSDFRVDLVLAQGDHPDAPLVAVLLDGRGWSKRKTVFDRDALPNQVLAKMMGWSSVERVWMPEWLTDQDAVISRLRGVVEEAAAEKKRIDEAAAAAQAAPDREEEAEPESTPELPDVVEHAAVAETTTEATAEPAEKTWAQRMADDIRAMGDSGSSTPAPGPAPAAEGAGTESRTGRFNFRLAGVGLPSTATDPDGESAGEASPNPAPEPPKPVAVPADEEPPAPSSVNSHGDGERELRDLSQIVPFKPAAIGRRGGIATLDASISERGAIEEVRKAARDIVAAEYPIQQRRMLLLVCNAFGLTKLYSSRQRKLMHTVKGAGIVFDDDGFAWPWNAEQGNLTGYRTGALRALKGIEEIHPRELRNLMSHVRSKYPPGVDDEVLMREALDILGQQRLTAGLRRTLAHALDDIRGRGA